MQMALNTSKNKIDYINTHGTSTPVGDITELKAVGEVFKENIPKISSTDMENLHGEQLIHLYHRKKVFLTHLELYQRLQNLMDHHQWQQFVELH